MIRNLLATTAVATLIASGASPRRRHQLRPSAAPATEQMAPAVAPAEGQLASNLIGETVYNGTGDDARRRVTSMNLSSGRKATSNPSLSVSAAFLALARKTWPWTIPRSNGPRRTAIAG